MNTEEFLKECTTIKEYADKTFSNWFVGMQARDSVREKLSLFQFLVKELGRRQLHEDTNLDYDKCKCDPNGKQCESQ